MLGFLKSVYSVNENEILKIGGYKIRQILIYIRKLILGFLQ